MPKRGPSSYTSSGSSHSDRAVRVGYIGAGAFLLLGLIPAVSNNWLRLNTDGIAYLRLAEYYATGQPSLMISGYWGPLLSWIIAPAIALGANPLAAGRAVVGMSGFLFWIGGVVLQHQMTIAPWVRIAAAWILAGAALVWSTDNLTPDLLVAGLICLASSQMLRQDWISRPMRQYACGAWWGLAYLAKAIALPLGLFCLLSSAALLMMRGSLSLAQSIRVLGRTLLTFGLIAGPWIAVLSVKYDRVTFSTSAAIAHAVAGPTDQDRYHPFARQFHRPEPGRITSWEDPSRANYQFWSPFESWAYGRHQGELILRNAGIVLSLARHQDWLGLGAIALGANLLVGVVGGRKPQSGALLSWCVAPVGLFLLYLPVALSAAELRYFYAVYPFGLGAALGWASRWTRASSEPLHRLARWAPILVVFSFALPVIVTVPSALSGTPHASTQWAHGLATRMKALGMQGPIAGSGLHGSGRVGLSLAYFLGTPWYGDRAEPSAESFRESGARFAVVRRDTPVSEALLRTPGVRDLDAFLFADPAQASGCPVRVFDLSPPEGP